MGRWYARGVAQLQNYKEQIRNLAPKGMGIGIDLRLSYPSFLAGLIAENVTKRWTTFSINETNKMIRKSESLRSEVARELSIKSATGFTANLYKRRLKR